VSCRSTAPGQTRRNWGEFPPPRCKNFPSRGHLFGAYRRTIEGCTCIAWNSATMADLQTKAEKYETKAARCEQWALAAPVGPQRDLYEVLARYYRELATDFRQVIEKRKAA